MVKLPTPTRQENGIKRPEYTCSLTSLEKTPICSMIPQRKKYISFKGPGIKIIPIIRVYPLEAK